MDAFANMNKELNMEENGFSDGFSDASDMLSENPFASASESSEVELPVQKETVSEGTQEKTGDENSCPETDKAEENKETAETDIKASAAETESEDKKRAEHEAAEAKRKEEWEARQRAKKEAEKEQLERIMAMSEADLMSESMKRVGTDTEKLTRRNMKECVSEYIQTMCLEDAAFARQVMLPQKNMIRCFQYINRKAYEYVQDEMKAAGIQPGRNTPCYSSDIPDDICYHWAEEYFRTMDVKEDKEDEEEFVPKPYIGRTVTGSKGKKTGTKKTAVKKTTEKKIEKKESADDGQISFMEQLSLTDMMSSERKAG